jgi:PKD repeat protein
MKTIKTFVLALAMIAVIFQGSAAIADSGSLSASFMASVNTGRAPLTVQFTDTSGGTPTAWQWDFGDGSYSTLQNPVYTYNTPGTYTVTLTVTDGALSDTMSADVVVTPPLAATPTPIPGGVPVIVQPILVPVKDQHHIQPPHKQPVDKVQPPVHKQPPHKDKKPVNKDQPVQKQPPVHKQPPHKAPSKPTDKPKHR